MRTSSDFRSSRRWRCGLARGCAAVLATFAALAVAPAADAGAARHPAHSATARQPAAHARASAASRGRIALDFALAQRGKPYVYGGTGPAVYDCSGLVQRAWRVAGVAIPRTTQQQAYTGKAVPLNEIQPGDLVIFYAHASHVGIYAGGGKVVVAPHQGARVMLEPMKWMPIYAVRRPR